MANNLLKNTIPNRPVENQTQKSHFVNYQQGGAPRNAETQQVKLEQQRNTSKNNHGTDYFNNPGAGRDNNNQNPINQQRAMLPGPTNGQNNASTNMRNDHGSFNSGGQQSTYQSKVKDPSPQRTYYGLKQQQEQSGKNVEDSVKELLYDGPQNTRALNNLYAQNTRTDFTGGHGEDKSIPLDKFPHGPNRTAQLQDKLQKNTESLLDANQQLRKNYGSERQQQAFDKHVQQKQLGAITYTQQKNNGGS